MKTLITIVLAGSLFLASCSRMGAQTMDESGAESFEGEGFCVMLAPGASVDVEQPVEDFTIYKFSSQDGTFLYAYEGNQPRFPRVAGQPYEEEVIAIGNRKGKCVRKDGAFECLFELDETVEFPQFVHFWHENQSDSQRTLAESVISSFKDRAECE